MLHIDNTKTRVEVLTDKELRDKYEHDMLKNEIKMIGLIIAFMLFTYFVITL